MPLEEEEEMPTEKTAREIQIEHLKKIADGKIPELDIERAKSILKYVTKVPENMLEVEIHKLFLELCEREHSGVRARLDFWVQVAEGQLIPHCIVGEVPKNLGELVNYEKSIFVNDTFSTENNNLLALIEERFAFRFREALFRADANKFRQGTRSTVALMASHSNLLVFYHKDASRETAMSFLRKKHDWWLKK